MLHNVAISSALKHTIDNYIHQTDIARLTNRSAIASTALLLIEQIKCDFPRVLNDIEDIALAYTLSALTKYACKVGVINVQDYLAIYATQKREAEKINQRDKSRKPDFGAFGDLLEVLARAALLPNKNLLNWSHISVKQVLNSDIISRKYGRLEVGHNQKTWNEASLQDYMSGKYQAIIYGMFDVDCKQNIYTLCVNRQVEEAITYVKNYCVMYRNKYDFLEFTHTLAKNGIFRAKITKARGLLIQNDYNASIERKFFAAIENGEVVAMIDGIN